jgi:hypothetical protein
MPDEARREMYAFAVDTLRGYGFKGDVGICKEAAEMAGEFGGVHRGRREAPHRLGIHLREGGRSVYDVGTGA